MSFVTSYQINKMSIRVVKIDSELKEKRHEQRQRKKKATTQVQKRKARNTGVITSLKERQEKFKSLKDVYKAESA